MRRLKEPRPSPLWAGLQSAGACAAAQPSVRFPAALVSGVAGGWSRSWVGPSADNTRVCIVCVCDCRGCGCMTAHEKLIKQADVPFCRR